jgi:Leucine-rich repeat (LRR) protein
MKFITTPFVLISSLLFVNTLKAQPLPADPVDSMALVDLYNSTNGPGWLNGNNWLLGEVRTWYGVTLLDDGHVASVQLPNNNLNGTIPASIGNLTQVFSINLSSNHLTGQLPSSGNFAQLAEIDVSNNTLSGSIPAVFGQLTDLETLDMSHNSFSGSIPASFYSLDNLEYLDLSFNTLTGILPDATRSLAGLLYLDLSNNQFTGNLPLAFATLADVEYFDVSNNQFNGAIPSFSAWSHVVVLKLENNHFTFAGLEELVQRFPFATYAPQANVQIIIRECKLAVAVGGTVTNNTYKWYKNNQLVATTTGDSTYAPPEAGDYRVSVTNAIAKDLTLHADNYHFVSMPKPDIGPDISQVYCPATYADISHLFDAVITSKGYTKVGWYTLSGIAIDPTLAPFANHQLIVKNDAGCRDTALVNPALYPVRNIVPAKPQEVIANMEKDSAGWTNYYYTYSENNVPNTLLLLSIKKNGNDIGTIGDGTFQVKLASTAKAGSGTAAQIANPLVTNPTGFWSMNRYWNVTPTKQPTTNVGVLFYFNTADYEDVKGSVPTLTDASQLQLFKLGNGVPDPEGNWQGATGVQPIMPGTTPSLTTWVYTFLGCTEHQAEFEVSRFSGGGAGATPDGKPLTDHPMPVKLVTFSGSSTEAGVKLFWATVEESNLLHFELQRSLDGQNFTSIAVVRPTGGTAARAEYTHIDNGAASGGLYFYRLKSVDRDDTYSYSNTIAVSMNGRAEEIQLYPNPARKFFTLVFNKPGRESVDVIVYDVSGRVAIKQTIVPQQRAVMSTEMLYPGYYRVLILSKNKTSYEKSVLILPD